MLPTDLSDFTNLTDSIEIEVDEVTVEKVELITESCDCDCSCSE